MSIKPIEKRLFSTQAKQALLSRIKDNPRLIDQSKIVSLLRSETQIDLVSYDYMLASILQAKEKSKVKFDIEQFFRLSVQKSLTPTKEQLCMLTEFHLQKDVLNSLSTPQRLSIMHSVARMESNICRITNSAPFFDELHDYYEGEIDDFAYASLSMNPQ